MKIEGARKRLPTGPRGQRLQEHRDRQHEHAELQHVGDLVRRPAGLAREDQRIDHEDRNDAEMLDRADPRDQRRRLFLGAVAQRGWLLPETFGRRGPQGEARLRRGRWYCRHGTLGEETAGSSHYADMIRLPRALRDAASARGGLATMPPSASPPLHPAPSKGPSSIAAHFAMRLNSADLERNLLR